MFFFRMSFDNGMGVVDTNLYIRQKTNGATVYSVMAECDDITLPCGMMPSKGIMVEKSRSSVKIFNDSFATIPIYVYSDGNDIAVSSIAKDFDGKKLTPDIVGVYETLLYESGLYSRTIFTEIKELPAACYVEITPSDGGIHIAPYWDFDISREECSEEEAIEKVETALCASFKKSVNNTDCLMGLSGGLDSRLSMHILNKSGLLDRVKPFTFGCSKHVLDYTLATKVCNHFSKASPVFYQLKDSDYLNSLNLSDDSMGSVSMVHGHIYNYINNGSFSEQVLISNYYSDALLGYDCRPHEVDVLENSEYYKKAMNNDLGIPGSIVEQIIADINKIADRRTKTGNYSSYDEFFYIVERNPKFHIKLSYLLSKNISVCLPYSDWELFRTVISLPMEIRYYKRIEKLILSKSSCDFSDISSIRYSGKEKSENSFFKKLFYNTGFAKMRVLNRVNSFLCVLSGGRLQISNRYITENHLAVYNRLLKQKYSDSVKFITAHVCDTLLDEHKSSVCIRTSEAQFRMNVISLAHSIQKRIG